MICEGCTEEFHPPVGTLGGQNRKLCYFCLPEGLDKNERRAVRSAVLRDRADREKLERGCSICSYNKCASALEWHHPHLNKEANPSDLLKRSWDAYEKETIKCILVCRNCHAEIHHDR